MYVGNPVLSAFFRPLFRTDTGDAHPGMRGFTKDVYERMDLRTTGMEFNLVAGQAGSTLKQPCSACISVGRINKNTM